MFEIVQNFEKLAKNFDPAFLLISGLTLVLIGLIIWLAGLRFFHLLLFIFFASAGFIVSFILMGRKMAPGIIFAGLLAVLSVLFKKTFVVILTAALAIFITLIVLAHKNKTNSAVYPVGSAKITSTKEILNSLSAWASNSAYQIKAVASKLSISEWIIMAFSLFIMAALGYLLTRPAAALCFSVLGTFFIATGMILLLLHKNASPIAAISEKHRLYSIVFGVMAAFGAFEQLIFCQIPKKKPIMKKGTDKDKKD